MRQTMGYNIDVLEEAVPGDEIDFNVKNVAGCLIVALIVASP